MLFSLWLAKLHQLTDIFFVELC